MPLQPARGFSMPCCAECAERNPEGCPGDSVWCIDTLVALDRQCIALVEAVEHLATAATNAVVMYAPSRSIRGYAARVQDGRARAVTSVRLIQIVVRSLEGAGSR